MKKIPKGLKIVLILTLFLGLAVTSVTFTPEVAQARMGRISGGGGFGRSRIGTKIPSKTGAKVSKSVKSSKTVKTTGGVTSKSPVTRSKATIPKRSSQSPAARSQLAASRLQSSVSPSSRQARTAATNKLSASSPAARKSIKEATNMYSGFSTNTARGIYSPADYLYRPYGAGFFYNYYMPYYFLSSLNATQQKAAESAGIDAQKIQHPAEETYWLTVTTSSGAKQAVLVTRAQYEKINPGDQLTLAGKKLAINNRVLNENGEFN